MQRGRPLLYPIGCHIVSHQLMEDGLLYELKTMMESVVDIVEINYWI